MLDPKADYGEDFPGGTFRVLKENEMRKYGEYRTQRLVMHYYRAWRDGAMGEFDRRLPPQLNRRPAHSGSQMETESGGTARARA